MMTALKATYRLTGQVSANVLAHAPIAVVPAAPTMNAVTINTKRAVAAEKIAHVISAATEAMPNAPMHQMNQAVNSADVGASFAKSGSHGNSRYHSNAFRAETGAANVREGSRSDGGPRYTHTIRCWSRTNSRLSESAGAAQHMPPPPRICARASSSYRSGFGRASTSVPVSDHKINF